MYMNHEHYSDPTASMAILQQARAERAARRAAERMMVQEMLVCLRREPDRFVQLVKGAPDEPPCLLCSIGGRYVAFGLASTGPDSRQSRMFHRIGASGGLTYRITSIPELEDILLRLEGLVERPC